jgi:hypothetical protein
MMHFFLFAPSPSSKIPTSRTWMGRRRGGLVWLVSVLALPCRQRSSRRSPAAAPSHRRHGRSLPRLLLRRTLPPPRSPLGVAPQRCSSRHPAAEHSRGDRSKVAPGGASGGGASLRPEPRLRLLQPRGMDWLAQPNSIHM